MKANDVIALITSDELTNEIKQIIIANYMDVICYDEIIFNMIIDNRIDPILSACLIQRATAPQYLGCNLKLQQVINDIVEEYGKYPCEVVKSAIVALACYDDLRIINKQLDERYYKFIHEYFTEIYEYLQLLINNNQVRVMIIIEKLVAAIKSASTNDCFCELLQDLIYVNNDYLINSFPEIFSTTYQYIETIEYSTNHKHIVEQICEYFKSYSMCYFDYNSVLSSLNMRHHTLPEWKAGDASIDKDKFEIISHVVDLVTLQFVDKFEEKDSMQEISRLLGVSSGNLIIVPCAYAGSVKGIFVMHSIDDIRLDSIVELVLFSKQIGIKVSIDESSLIAIRYYNDFVRQQSLAVKSINHQISPALGSLRTALPLIRKEYVAHSLSTDVVELSIASYELINDSVMLMSEYTDVERTPFAINSIVDVVIKLLEVQIREVMIDVVKEYCDDNVYIIKSPGIMICIQHLITNSIESLKTKSGKDKKITITTSYDSMSNEVKVSIADNGQGIAQNIKEKLFKMNVSTKGGGLGLTISHAIINDIGGEINYIDLEQGAEFYVSIPGGYINV